MAYESILCKSCEHRNEECYCSPNSVCRDYKAERETNCLELMFEQLNIKNMLNKKCLAVLAFNCYENTNSGLNNQNKDTLIIKLIHKICKREEFDIIYLASQNKEKFEETLNKNIGTHIVNIYEYMMNYLKGKELVEGIKI